MSKSFLRSFIIVPYFARHACKDVLSNIWNLHVDRPLCIAFIGCITTAIDHAGFGVRKLLSEAPRDNDDARVIDTCDTASRRRVSFEDTRLLYSQANFCLIIGGDAVSSVRMYETMASLCIPIYTDYATMVPFVDDIPWGKIAFYHPISSILDVHEMYERLRCLPPELIRSMRKYISEHSQASLEQGWRSNCMS